MSIKDSKKMKGTENNKKQVPEGWRRCGVWTENQDV